MTEVGRIIMDFLMLVVGTVCVVAAWLAGVLIAARSVRYFTRED